MPVHSENLLWLGDNILQCNTTTHQILGLPFFFRFSSYINFFLSPSCFCTKQWVLHRQTSVSKNHLFFLSGQNSAVLIYSPQLWWLTESAAHPKLCLSCIITHPDWVPNRQLTSKRPVCVCASPEEEVPVCGQPGSWRREGGTGGSGAGCWTEERNRPLLWQDRLRPR